jgi:hypothetical protein
VIQAGRATSHFGLTLPAFSDRYELELGHRSVVGGEPTTDGEPMNATANAIASAQEATDRPRPSGCHDRENFFKPAKPRQAAQGKFRGKDYGYHCECGGHPVPGAGILLDGDIVTSQLLLSDLLGHVGRIWDHLVGWARRNDLGGPILARSGLMSKRFAAWKERDSLVGLPPPP